MRLIPAIIGPMRNVAPYSGTLRTPLQRTAAAVVVLTMACVPVCFLEAPPTLPGSPQQTTLETDHSSWIAVVQSGPASTWKGLRLPLECGGPHGVAAFTFDLPSAAPSAPRPAMRAPAAWGSRAVLLLKRQLQV